MKKTIKSLLAIAVAAFAFTSCSDVPEPYQIPGMGKSSNDGTLPYSSTNLKTGWSLIKVTSDQPWIQDANYVQATGYQKWDGADAKFNRAVEGWLISPAISTEGKENVKLSFNHTIKYTNNVSGWEAFHKVYACKNYDENNFNDASWVELTNFTPVASPYSDWTLYSSGELQLPAEMCNQESIRIGFWFKAPATGSTTWELKDFNILEGIAGESNPTDEKQIPDGLMGQGTAEEPYTVADAHKIIDVFDTSESPEVYVRGTVVSREFSSQHGSMTYFISDDGTTTDQLEVYGGKYFNKQAFTSEEQLSVGDVVVVVGKLVNYQSKTREITQGNYIYMQNGQTSGGEVEPQPQPIDGENLLPNGDFEQWSGNTPVNWKSSTTASNATLSQSTDAHAGSYAVKITHDATANKRMAYKEITLKAGTYFLSFYVKAASGTTSVRPGYTNVLENGKANSTYTYGNYVNDITTDWQLVTHTFTLGNTTKLNLVIMLPSKSGSDTMIDDATLTTSDGGLADGGQTEPEEPVTPMPAGNSYFEESFANGQGAFTIEDKTQITGIWTAGTYSSDKYMQATSYMKLTGETSKTNHDAESWLISPEIDLSNANAPTLTFNQVINKYFGTIENEAMVYIKKNGGSWTKLPMTYPAKPSSTFSKFTDNGASVSINISSYKGGIVRFAFVYVGKATTAGTWEVKDVKVAEAQ